MTDKELKKLNRLELLELLVAQGKDLAECQAQLATKELELTKANETIGLLNEQVTNGIPVQIQASAVRTTWNEFDLDEPGNIAEAALRINGVFEAAQAACDDYIENIKRLNDEQELMASERMSIIEEEANRLLEDTKQRCVALERITKDRCQEKIKATEKEAGQYWADLSGKLEAFYEAHQGLKELLSSFDSLSRGTGISSILKNEANFMTVKLADKEGLAG